MPGSKQACPNSAACWSPRTPETGTPSSTPDAAPRSASAAPRRPADGRTSGRVAIGTPKRSHSSADQASVSVSSNRVRLALEGSVAYTPPARPPVRFHRIQVSTVQKESLGSSAPISRTPLRNSQAAFVALKYGSRTNPVVARTSGRWPASVSSAQMPAVRRSCQTMARCSACPVVRSKATRVSRWLVMPRAATVSSDSARRAPTSERVDRTAPQISAGSCSTQPGRGKCWVSSR